MNKANLKTKAHNAYWMDNVTLDKSQGSVGYQSAFFEKRSKVVPWGVFITFPTFSISFLESPASDDIIMAERETKMTTYPYPPSLGTCPNIQ